MIDIGRFPWCGSQHPARNSAPAYGEHVDIAGDHPPDRARSLCALRTHPAYRDLRTATVTTTRQAVGRPRGPWWALYGVDVVLIVGGGVVVWAASGNGYQLVLARKVSRASRCCRITL
jgi:hypothetical protein